MEARIKVLAGVPQEGPKPRGATGEGGTRHVANREGFRLGVKARKPRPRTPARLDTGACAAEKRHAGPIGGNVRTTPAGGESSEGSKNPRSAVGVKQSRPGSCGDQTAARVAKP